MLTEQITTTDVLEWNSVDAIAQSLEDRGLEIQEETSGDGVALRFEDNTRLLVTVDGGGLTPERSVDLVQLSQTYQTIIVATNGFTHFDIYSRPTSATDYGQRTFDHYSFTKKELHEENQSSRTIIERLNKIESYNGDSVEQLFDDLGIIENFTKTYQRMIEEVESRCTASIEPTLEEKRRYAQRTLNRFLYLYILEKSGILPEDYLEDEHGRIAYSGRDVFEDLFNHLFRGEIPSDIDKQIEPYLDNFLFEESSVEISYQDIRPADTTEEVNQLFEDMFESLSNWEWRIGGEYNLRHTTAITPRIIGHALERYINKQGSGTYHTPAKLNRFLVREGLEEALLANLNDQINSQYDSVSQIFRSDSSSQTPDIGHIETLYFEVLHSFHIIDPAVGSGSFIEQAQQFLADIYIECFDHLENSTRADELPYPLEDTDKILLAQHLSTRRNLFGVDLNPEAIELTQFRLHLSLLSAIGDETQREISLFRPACEFNFWVGNSLIGFANTPSNGITGQQTLLPDEQSKLHDLRRVLRQYRSSVSIDSETVQEIRNLYSNVEDEIGQAFYNQLRDFCSFETSVENLSDALDPFHWPLRFPDIVISGGFDVIVSNPPWGAQSQATPKKRRANQSETNTEPSQTQADYQREYFANSEEYHLRERAGSDLSLLFVERAMNIGSPAGTISMLVPGKIFTASEWRSLREKLLREKSLNYAIGFENHGIFSDFRRQFQFGLIQFRNSGRTETVWMKSHQTTLDILDDPRFSLLEISADLIESYSPNQLTFPSVETVADVRSLDSIVQHPSLASSEGWNVETFRGLNQAREAEYLFEDDGEYPVYGGRNIYQFVHDTTYFELDQPVYWGLEENSSPSAKTRVRERELHALDRKYADIELGSQSITFGDGRIVDRDEVPMPFDEYRIAYRDITNPQNERVMIAALLPPEVVCLNTLHTIHPYDWRRDNRSNQSSYDDLFRESYDVQELLCLLGLLNSLPFDYLIRTKVSSHLSDYLLKESQAPPLTYECTGFEKIWKPAAKLNCYGEKFGSLREELAITSISEPSERRESQASIDAAAFHVYGFEDSDVVWSVMDSLPRVRSPRLIDDEYLDMVLERFNSFEGEF